MIGPPAPFSLAILGLVLGHLVRRGVPRALGLRDRRLPFHSPWVELLTAGAFGVAAWHHLPWPAYALTLLLVATTACDLRAKLIPDGLTAGGLVLGLVAGKLDPFLIRAIPLHDLLVIESGLEFRGPWTGLGLALAGAALGFGLVWAIRVVFHAAAGIEAMGLGDAKLLAAVGAFVGPVGAILTLAASFFLGAVHGAIAAWRTGRPHFAFGPSLALAAWGVAVGSDTVIQAVGAFQSLLFTLPTPVLVAGYSALLAVVVYLVLRLRRKAAEYEEWIEDDYRQIEQELDGPQT